MNIPPAGVIEMAVDDLKNVPQNKLLAQQKELYSATGNDSKDFGDGYALGLQTARKMLAQSPLLMMKDISFEELL